MAGVDYDEYEGEYDAPQRPARVQRALNLAGGLVSVALILGLAVWGYKLAVRDVTGIPVVRAMEGPMRIAPEDPGGEIAAHQGLSVNDVAAVGVASPPPERLVLAPRPVELSLEDAAGLSTEPAPVEGEGSDELAMDAAAEEDPAPLEAPSQQPEPAAEPLIEDPTRLAIAEALADTVEPLSADTSLPDPAALEDPLAEGEPEVEVAAAPAGAVTRSPRPPQRPASASAGVTLAAAAPAAAAPVKEVDPATLASGTRLVQLGAFDDAEAARREWVKLSGTFGELMQGKARVVQEAQSGGRTFYRLRAEGFADEDDARRFCSALLAENTACIPVAVR
jgi:hypothetical protein